MTTLLHDLRFAVRGLRHSPLFATVAIASLALGIGANAAIFRLIDQLLLRTLPVTAPEQLVMLYQEGPHMGSNMGSRMHSYPLYQDLQKKAQPLAQVLCRRLVSASLSVGNQTERVEAEMVSGNYFSMLGVKPALGRVFNSREDDQVYQGHPVAVLSYGYWLSRFAVTRALLALMPSQEQPLLISAHPDPRVLAFTLALTLATAVVFGLLPALRASRPDPWTTLKDTMGSIAGTGGSLFLRKGLVTTQVALSFLLLFGAGLFVRSLQNLKTADAGVALENLVVFEIAPALSGYDNQRATLLYGQLLDRLRSAPGVKSAGLANVAILAGDEWDSSMSVEGHQAKDGEDMQAFMNAVSPGYFETMKVPFLEGRDFRSGDAKQEATVAIVNRRFAGHFFPGKSAVGKRVGFGDGPGTKLNIEIVGVVADALYEGPREGVHRQVFIPLWGRNSGVFYLRTRTPTSSAYNLVRSEVRHVDSAIPVYGMKTLEAQLDDTLLTDRLVAMLSAGFGLLATLLASIGLYGVMAFLVARRRKELGIRLALGAQPGFVIWVVMREVLLLLAIGLVVGIPAAMALGRYVAGQLYGIQPNDPAIAGWTVLLLTVVSAAAGLIPAQRASRIDPILALRSE